MKGMNKKGQGMSTNTIILLILGLIILAALAIGFSTGFSAFKAEVGRTNVDQISEQCATSCNLDQKFGFCSTDVDVRIQERELEYSTSCGVLATVPEFKEMTVNTCPRITCDVPCTSVRINGNMGEIVESIDTNVYHDVTAFASDVAEGKFCAIIRA